MKMLLQVQLIAQPQHTVWVETTESANRAKRKSIANDIRSQKFTRWAPFRGAVLGEHYTIRAFREDGETPFFE